jgi:hypothetical protein
VRRARDKIGQPKEITDLFASAINQHQDSRKIHFASGQLSCRSHKDFLLEENKQITTGRNNGKQ